MRKTRDMRTRLLSKIKIGPGDCWTWTGYRHKKKYGGDYGIIGIGPRHNHCLRRAHVVSYEVFVGQVPSGLELHHVCQNTLCINPEHLVPVSHSENMRHRKDSGLPTCRHGHIYTEETTFINSKGRRECRVCRDESHERWYEKYCQSVGRLRRKPDDP
jgi:hypothetical protein